MNILVCFDNNDCLTTRINGSLQEVKKYYIDNFFNGNMAKFVLDTNKPFQMKVEGINDDFITYSFDKINYHEHGFDIVLNNLPEGYKIEVEPQWFFINNKRIIKQ